MYFDLVTFPSDPVTASFNLQCLERPDESSHIKFFKIAEFIKKISCLQRGDRLLDASLDLVEADPIKGCTGYPGPVKIKRVPF